MEESIIDQHVHVEKNLEEALDEVLAVITEEQEGGIKTLKSFKGLRGLLFKLSESNDMPKRIHEKVVHLLELLYPPEEQQLIQLQDISRHLQQLYDMDAAPMKLVLELEKLKPLNVTFQMLQKAKESVIPLLNKLSK